MKGIKFMENWGCQQTWGWRPGRAGPREGRETANERQSQVHVAVRSRSRVPRGMPPEAASNPTRLTFFMPLMVISKR